MFVEHCQQYKEKTKEKILGSNQLSLISKVQA
jgi:hypothetical protein